ncbi:MAG TPA: endonuclease/exonuclease/phosphatase family protein [Rhodocyclaceae bacterium]|nr:endonuclease/exonuclease/phosphatase family protein [Rhodocyclaceae bacterium]HND23423.1 endonuclease/exonuclease/phosphatase family protein [Rhodocyclaceae bacterium]
MHDRTEDPMKILSWNIQWGRGADGMVTLERTVSAVRTLGEFDVICLQEVAVAFPALQGGVPVDGVASIAAAFPDYSVHFASGVDMPDGNGGRSRFGNLTLSRLPVGQVFRHSLPRPPEPGMPSMPRVCLETVVEGPQGWVRVMNTHLEYYSAVQRMTQIAALHTLQQDAVRLANAGGDTPGRNAAPGSPFEVLPRPASAVICGDFNCEPGSPEYFRMIAPIGPDVSGWEDAWRACYGDIPHLSTVGLNGAEWPDHAYCCDYFFVSADLVDRVAAVAVDQLTAASDHQPIVLSLD